MVPDRVVVTITSIPPRIRRIVPLLKSLERQTLRPDAVYLRLCRFYRRWQVALEPRDLPAAVRRSPEIALRWDEDRGPFTKLAGTLLEEPDPGTLLVIADDDRTLPPWWLERLVHAANAHPGAAVAYRGRRLVRDPAGHASLRYVESRVCIDPPAARAVDLCTGAMGVAFDRERLDDDVIDEWSTVVEHHCPGMFYADDIWISGHLARANVPRLIVPVAGRLSRGNHQRTDFFLNRRAHRTQALYDVNAGGRHNDEALAHFAREWDVPPNSTRSGAA